MQTWWSSIIKMGSIYNIFPKGPCKKTWTDLFPQKTWEHQHISEKELVGK